MLSRLQSAENRYEELTQKLTDPEVLGDAGLYRKVVTEHSELEEIVTAYREYKEILKTFSETKALLNESLEEDFHALVQAEYEEAKEKKAAYEQKLKFLLTPKDLQNSVISGFRRVVIQKFENQVAVILDSVDITFNGIAKRGNVDFFRRAAELRYLHEQRDLGVGRIHFMHKFCAVCCISGHSNTPFK